MNVSALLLSNSMKLKLRAQNLLLKQFFRAEKKAVEEGRTRTLRLQQCRELAFGREGGGEA